MSELSEEAAGALRAALGAEHAAVWTYGLATAFAGEPRVRSAIEEAASVHERHRDAADRLIRGAGGSPQSAAPAYALPQPVTDQGSAIRVLITVEQECQVGWRSVLENTEAGSQALRQAALDALTASATRATRWRLTIGEQPAASAQPGKP